MRPAVLRGAVVSMATLNRSAAEAVMAAGAPHACTDITGFGLIGHLNGMMKASGTTAHLELSAIPLLPGVRELVGQGIAPGGTLRNLESVGRQVRWHPDLTNEDKLLLCDAQTSGGLLVSVGKERLSRLVRELKARNILAAVIGSVSQQGDAPIEVAP
jgi:selenide,water dikinase